MIGKTIGRLKVGDRAAFSKTVGESDIYLYAGITGDLNPAHINQIYAEKTFFKDRIAHGLLSAGFISTVIASQLPGPGTIYIRQELNFTAPVYIGDTITASVEILEIDMEKNRVILETLCKNQGGKTVVEGKAVVSPPKKSG
ncbi:MAG: MaoC family dehydratase [Deltaproteobacteria bacterium]